MDRKTAEGFHCPRWAELPSLPLYMDQVVLVLDEAIGVFAAAGERVVTASMVNNYVKHGLVQAPDRKRYGRNQLAALVVVSVMKRVLSMHEITDLVRLCIGTYGIEKAYDLFCQRLEQAMKTGYSAKAAKNMPPATADTGEDAAAAAMQAALQALMGRLVLQDILAKLPAPAPEAKAKEPKPKKEKG